MTAADPLRIALVVEAPADARTVIALIDKVLLGDDTHPSCSDAKTLPTTREWVSISSNPSTDHATWTTVVKDPRARVIGHRGTGKSNPPYYLAARRAIQLGVLHQPRLDVLVLVVDADAQRERREGFREAKADVQPVSFAIVIGVADPKREAWILNAFEPRTPQERSTKDKLTRELSLDPCTDAHRLRGPRGDRREIKRVLTALIGCDNSEQSVHRELEILQEAPLTRLRERGQATGLTEFLDAAKEIGERLALTPVKRDSAKKKGLEENKSQSQS